MRAKAIKLASVFYMGNESCQLTHNSESYENYNVPVHVRLAIAFIYLLAPKGAVCFVKLRLFYFG